MHFSSLFYFAGKCVSLKILASIKKWSQKPNGKSVGYYIKLSIHFPYMCWPKVSTQELPIGHKNQIFARQLGCLSFFLMEGFKN